MPRRRSGKKIDFTHWATGQDSGSFAAGTVAATLFSAEHGSQTLLRMRGEWAAILDGGLGVATFIRVSVGIILVPEGTGTTVLWKPFTDGNAPWIYVSYATLGYEEPVTDIIGITGLAFIRQVIDNKAMRIVRNQEIQIVWENTTLNAAGTVNIAATVRALSGT